jgi:hypothetical protein
MAAHGQLINSWYNRTFYFIPPNYIENIVINKKIIAKNIVLNVNLVL